MEEALDDFMTMYGAGNATTQTTLLWVLAELTRNPAVMTKLVDEVGCASDPFLKIAVSRGHVYQPVFSG